MSNQTEGQDRRVLERFSLRLCAKLQELRDRERLLEAYTRDVSSDGAFFYIDEPLPVESPVKTTLFLRIGGTVQSKVDVGGTVVRSDEDGVAVRFDSRYNILKL